MVREKKETGYINAVYSNTPPPEKKGKNEKETINVIVPFQLGLYEYHVLVTVV